MGTVVIPPSCKNSEKFATSGSESVAELVHGAIGRPPSTGCGRRCARRIEVSPGHVWKQSAILAEIEDQASFGMRDVLEMSVSFVPSSVGPLRISRFALSCMKD